MPTLSRTIKATNFFQPDGADSRHYHERSGLVATSVHPYLAGLQNAPMQLLLDRGAGIDQPDSGGKQHSAVASCLANGRGEAAVYLAERGASLDLKTAVGVGRLDVVRSFFDKEGALKPNATREELESGFLYACGWWRHSIVEFLLQQGLDPRVHNEQGETGLHWAAGGGDVDVVKLLLERGAPVSAKDKRFGDTPLGWAMYGWRQTPSGAERWPYEEVVALLVAAGSTVKPEWLADEKVIADP